MRMKSKKAAIIILAIGLLIYLAGCGLNPTEEENLLPRSEVRPLEDDLFDLVNQARTDEGIPTLEHDENLRVVAYEYSEEMYRRDFFSHVDPQTDEDVVDRLDNAGIDFTLAGENIAKNTGYDDPVQAAHDSLMASSGHRANILNDAFELIGCGIATDGDLYYYTEVFTDDAGSRLYFTYIKYKNQEPAIPWEMTTSFEKAWNSWQE